MQDTGYIPTAMELDPTMYKSFYILPSDSNYTDSSSGNAYCTSSVISNENESNRSRTFPKLHPPNTHAPELYVHGPVVPAEPVSQHQNTYPIKKPSIHLPTHPTTTSSCASESERLLKRFYPSQDFTQDYTASHSIIFSEGGSPTKMKQKRLVVAFLLIIGVFFPFIWLVGGLWHRNYRHDANVRLMSRAMLLLFFLSVIVSVVLLIAIPSIHLAILIMTK